MSIIILLILFFGLGSLLIPNQKTEYPEFFAESPSPTGIKAFYSFLKNQQSEVQVWERPVEQLPSKATKQLMLMIEPNTMFNKGEQEKWIEWMERGNDLWLITQYPEGYFDIKTELKESRKDSQIKRVRTENGSFQAMIESDLRLVPKAGDEKSIDDTLGPIALTRSYGKGKLTVLLTPEWFQNEHIIEYDHLQLVLPLLNDHRPKTVWFNEYIHGYQSQLAIIEAYPKWFLLIFAQVALLVLLWIWYRGKRFGPAETPREWVVRFGDERIKAQAVWYQKGEFYQETLSHQLEYLRLILQEKWGIPVNMEPKDFIELTKRRLPSNKQSRWEQNWSELIDLSRLKKISHKQFLTGSKLIDDMRKEVQE